MNPQNPSVKVLDVKIIAIPNPIPMFRLNLYLVYSHCHGLLVFIQTEIVFLGRSKVPLLLVG